MSSTIFEPHPPTSPSHTDTEVGRLPRIKIRWDVLMLAAIIVVVIGAALRWIGLSWGLPLQLNSDEWVIVHGAIDMAKRNSFEPPYFFRPDHLEMQLSYLAYEAYAHIFHGVSPEVLYATQPSPFFHISRAITALFGIGMIVVAYLIGSRFARPIGLLSATAVAFFPIFIGNSHYATPDIPLTFTCMLVILGCVRYLQSPSWPNLLLACLGVSLGFTVKYPAALGTLMIAIVIVISAVRRRTWGRIFTHGVVAICAVFGFIFALSPVLVTNIHEVMTQLTGQNTGGHLGASGLNWPQSMAFYAANFASNAGLLLVLLSLLAVVYCIRFRRVEMIPLGLGLIYWVGLSKLSLHWDRWGLPMYLTPLLLAPIGLYYLSAHVRQVATGRRWWRAGLSVGAALVLVNLVIGSIASIATFKGTDSRAYAQGYFRDHDITAENTVFEGYTPLNPGMAKLFFGSFEVVDGKLTVKQDPANPTGLRYVAVSSVMYGRYLAAPESEYPSERQVYELLDQQFPLIRTWESVQPVNNSILEVVNIPRNIGYINALARGGLAGPIIKLYAVPPAHA